MTIAARTPDLLASYLARIGRDKLLTRDEQVNLSRAARAGDEKARARRVRSSGHWRRRTSRRQ